MSWIRTGLVVVGVAAVGAVAFGSEDKPRYVGDAPSMFAGPPPAEPLPPLAPRDAVPVLEQAPPAPAPAAAPVVAPRPAPSPVPVSEVSGQRATYTGGFRADPGPGPDTARSSRPPAYEDDPDNPYDDIVFPPRGEDPAPYPS